MRGVVAKRLRRAAQLATVGKSQRLTRRMYKGLKRGYKRGANR